MMGDEFTRMTLESIISGLLVPRGRSISVGISYILLSIGNRNRKLRPLDVTMVTFFPVTGQSVLTLGLLIKRK